MADTKLLHQKLGKKIKVKAEYKNEKLCSRYLNFKGSEEHSTFRVEVPLVQRENREVRLLILAGRQFLSGEAYFLCFF